MVVTPKKPEAPPPAITVEVYEYWLLEWCAFGFAEMGVFLGKHAAFDDFYEHRGAL